MNALTFGKDMPIVPAAKGNSFFHIGGYKLDNCVQAHISQLVALNDQLSQYFQTEEYAYVSNKGLVQNHTDSITIFVAPKVTTVFGIKEPVHHLLAHGHLGVVPMAAIDFPGEPTSTLPLQEVMETHLIQMSFQEYFVHQVNMKLPPEFRGWQRNPAGNIVEIVPDAQGRLFSKALNVWLRWEEQPDEELRLLRAYLPDGTLIPTASEEEQLSLHADAMAAALAEALEPMQRIRVEAGYDRI